ncbi:hypothetical protein L7F22_025098 [Adiantum nelumboides]|nr:hypothetical protein [Adiantum nelumboides]
MCNYPRPSTVAQALENEATQSKRVENGHELRAGTSFRKDCDATKVEAYGKINGASHLANQKTTPVVNGGSEVLTESGMAESIVTQDEQGLKLDSKANNMYNPEHINFSHPQTFGLDARYHAAWGAIKSTVQDATTNGYFQIMQGPFKQSHQPSAPISSDKGLGIVEFLKGKTILITGATGFLAKVLVEKILRVQPDVEHLFLLIKADDVSHAKSRLQNEIMDSGLFKNLKDVHGSSYKKFMESKISPIVGNLAKGNLGMDVEVTRELQEKVEIIVNSAASTTFDERYDHALNLNTMGAQRVTQFANNCSKLQILIHVSTAFVNGQRKGVVKERAFTFGCSIANEVSTKAKDMVPDIDVDKELQVVKRKLNDMLLTSQKDMGVEAPTLDNNILEKELQQVMRDLGMQRAKNFGWQDTYVFTKALGEMLVDSTRRQTPVVIIRPSVVESSFRDPFPGWMEGNRMMDPILISYGKGQLPGFLVDPKSVLDVVPVDMVANAMLATMARHANKTALEVYQVASSVVNPLVFFELARMSREHFREHPFMDKFGKPLATPDLELFESMESFMDAVTTCSHLMKVSEEINGIDSPSPSTNAKAILRHKQLTLKVKQQAAYLASLYEPYTFYRGRFDTSKTQQLFASLSAQEKEVFGFDVGEIDWDTYIKTIHIPGLRKHVLKGGRGSSIVLELLVFLRKEGAEVDFLVPFALLFGAILNKRICRMPCNRQPKQWTTGPYEVDELATNEKAHILEDILAIILTHIFIARFNKAENDKIKATIMPQEILTLHQKPKVIKAVRATQLNTFFRLPPWGTDYMRAHELMSTIQYDGQAMLTDKDGSKVRVQITKEIVNKALHFSPGQHDLLQKTKAMDNEKAFLKTSGHKFKYSDLIYGEMELPLCLISQYFRVQKSSRYTEPILSNLKGSTKNKIYMSAGLMLTRTAYQTLGMIEDLLAASSQASLIQNARLIAGLVRTTTIATFARATRCSKQESSSNSEKTDTDKEGRPRQSSKNVPSKFEKSDEEDRSTPLKRKGTLKIKVPRSETQIAYEQAQARVEERRRQLATARAAKVAASEQQTMEQKRQARIEAAKKLQMERQRIAAK